ncbi:MAG: DEAD/DEAH box helicase, partial [Planctomycetota bacterium]
MLTASALEEFRAAITSNVKPDVVSASLHVTAPRGVSIPVARAKVRVRSFHFAPGHEPPTWCAATAGTQETAAPALRALPDLATERLPAGTSTRVRPPDDVIRLEDRLHYLLQPPLESLFVERELRFPFQPFPFQLAGVAFLFPRHAAILADEMGLGKTMQAVTSIRLLLHRGEIRNVLLVCPKPLVTNWQREFHTWAPEIPVMVIEGDQARRQWMWQLGDVPVRIANYEVVCRDREVFEEAGCGNREAASSPRASAAAFDLVVLDESQRIKNRSSATSQVVRSIARRRSWALTGTPVENSVEDLVGIFEFLAPGYLSADMKPRRMGRAVADFVLRRTKEQVLTDMPPKLIHDAPIELSPEQRESYRLAEDDGVVHLEAMGAEATIQHVFELVLRLKQICNFDPATGTSA